MDPGAMRWLIESKHGESHLPGGDDHGMWFTSSGLCVLQVKKVYYWARARTKEHCGVAIQTAMDGEIETSDAFAEAEAVERMDAADEDF